MKRLFSISQVACLLVSLLVSDIRAQRDGLFLDAQWIWSPAQNKDEVPVGDCFFRKTFSMGKPEAGQIQITADNRFELIINGRPVGTGNDWRQMQVYDVTKLLSRGKNCVAVRATNSDPGAAGLVARVLVKERGGTYEAFSTDATWKTSIRHFEGWGHPSFQDSDWVAAASHGTLGATLPWGDEVVIAGKGSRFVIGKQFHIDRVMLDEETGSLIAMTFDARGNILASREGGPLLRLVDSDGDGNHDTAETYCDQIKNVQGILALGTRIFAIGDGPEGIGLYCMRDADRDGQVEEITRLVSFRGSKGEHGPHAVRMGPDGMLYVIVGDHARVDATPAPRSPYRNWYEGDLVQPRYEDPQGHAVGIPAPGGTIFRTDTEGRAVELVAGGLRNAYDFVISPEGELFTYDADMEWDQGAPWYRPTRINHVTAGAELGWRSGWAKWPPYYLDSLPAALDMGAGSPTGVEFYDHTAFGPSYRGAMFACDWATGKIHCIRLQQQGATYKATDELFLEGKPLNATDLAVGPDGALYFCTGGRGTDGGIYRIRWEGSPEQRAARVTELGQGIDRALRQPQFDADWSRAAIAKVKRQLGDSWGDALDAACRDQGRPVRERLRAVDLMVFYGPRPTDGLLLELAGDRRPMVRAKAAGLMASSRDPQVSERLAAMLADGNPRVRRMVCESLMRHHVKPLAQAFLPLLADKDRFVAFTARRALEQLPTDKWRNLILEAADPQIFLHGAVGLLAANDGPNITNEILARCQLMLDSRPSVDLLRVIQLALIRDRSTDSQHGDLSSAILAHYPTDDPKANRELVRLLTHLQEPLAAARFAEQLASDLPLEDKLHIAGYACRLQQGWNADSKLALLKFFEQVRTIPGGYSVSAYVENFARDFFAKLNAAQQQHILARGEQWPTSSLSILATLPAQPGAELLGLLRELDERLIPLAPTDDVYRRLQVGIVAVLGRSGEAASLEYIRTIYSNEPKRRDPIAMSLTQHPEGENWAYLIDALKTVEGSVAREVLMALCQVPQRPQQSTPYRHVILTGLKLKQNGASDAIRLLEHWTGRIFPSTTHVIEDQLAPWQEWYTQEFPDGLAAELPIDTGREKWSFEELLTYLEAGAGSTGDTHRGQEVFQAAQCVNCHRHQGKGESVGPDLTTVGRRFRRKEILESIVYPSHMISDQYASKLVVVNGRAYAGLAIPRSQDGITLVLSDGTKREFDHEEIDDIRPSGQSVMPDGLMGTLSLQQVADLFSFLSEESPTEVARKGGDRMR